MKSLTSKKLLRTMFLKFRQFQNFTCIITMICKQVTKKYGERQKLIFHLRYWEHIKLLCLLLLQEANYNQPRRDNKDNVSSLKFGHLKTIILTTTRYTHIMFHL